jgi:ankyrin repeat protein
VRAQAQDGSTPLHLAATFGFVDCALLCLKSGAETSAVDTYGNTPLHVCLHVSLSLSCVECCADGEKYACEWNQADVVTLLLEHGAAVDARNAGASVRDNLMSKYSADKLVRG